MAAVVYGRTLISESAVSVDFLVAKTKLAPICSLRPSTKPAPRITIPRLELRAALIAVRMLCRICEELELPREDCSIWLDSKLALGWITSLEPTNNSVVDSYVHQIQELTPRNIWRYVPSGLNPADVASRGAPMKELVQANEWFSGPDWLRGDQSQWPSDQHDEPDPSYKALIRSVLANITERHDAAHLKYFSNLDCLLTFLVRLRRHVRRRLSRTPALAVLAPLMPEELSVALEACIRLSQRPEFSEEIAFLERTQKKEKPEPLPGER